MRLEPSSYYRIRITNKGNGGSSYIGSFKTKEEAQKKIEHVPAFQRNDNFYSLHIEQMEDMIRYEFSD
tara:strand:- start:326 stop:529 length:204 start_codon:yes stop_codon:yes gene_type:complete